MDLKKKVVILLKLSNNLLYLCMYVNKYIKYRDKCKMLAGNFKSSDFIKSNKKKILGKGTYGCVISPPLKCLGDVLKPKQSDPDYAEKIKEYTKLTSGLVSKLMLPEEAEKEFQTTRIVSSFDPDSTYLIYPVRICDVNPDDLFKNKEKTEYIDAIQTCINNDYNPLNMQNDEENIFLPENAKLLYYRYGGKEIFKLNLNPNQIFLLFTNVLHLLNGVNTLHQNNFVHMDINNKNVIVQKNNLLPRLIDFGLSIKIEDYFTKIFDENGGYPDVLNVNYVIWPIELRFISKMFCKKLSKTNLLSKVRYILNQLTDEPHHLYTQLSFLAMNNNIPEILLEYNNIGLIQDSSKFWSEIIDTAIEPKLNNDIMDSWRQSLPTIPNDLFQYKLVQGSPEFELFSKILKGVDIYSLGFLLSELYLTYVGQIPLFIPHNNKMYKILNSELNPIDINYLNITFLDTLYDELTIPYFEFVKKLVNFNFNLRLDITSTINEFMLILPRFNILLSDEFKELHTVRHSN